jgi:hypothetical protein
MIILKEKEKFNEMAIQVVSDRKDRLPFRVTVQSPDFDPPHAHIRDLETGRKKLGAFVVPSSPPAKPEDLKDYEEGISPEMRKIVFQWINKPSQHGYPGTNWGFLNLLCSLNRKW